ncbi:TonB-dependent receptor [Pseudomaricurvus alkylphenolicus]|uniref:TonB-dependent receptor plug domain-containing protein n=1 Tax=Pseudomaricurvus alkylphenolicus TaxID=1306991 RepID=UPI0014248EC0|nr:TonB-dependent receptor [Pseudomaricurvus alkylphenolicus]NIB38576.1 TonB-dependent receptor [Pseudomaricurvus alkylphenolicus]
MRSIYTLTSLSIMALTGSLGTAQVLAQSGNGEYADGSDIIEEVITTGTRIQGRSALDSAAPVDVLSGDDFTNQGANDLGDLLRTIVPSYNVNAQPISDAATFVRPANLRGLAPDHTLVLMNGKRRHRSAVIAFYGAGLSDGAQGPDISVLPSIALEQVEVLRDGAAAQYGSDAIAGVMNFKLKDDSEGGSLEIKAGTFYEGDGDSLQLAGNIGLPLTSNGFANLSIEYNEADPTDRSVQRDDAAALIAAGNSDVADPAQIWGSPELKEDLKIVANLGLDLDADKTFYAFGNYANKSSEGGLYYRNPSSREGVYTRGGAPLIGDLDGVNQGIDCSGASLAQVMDNNTSLGANCFVFNELYPGGFTPTMEGEVTDLAGVVGVRGSLDSGWNYDVSVGAGYSEVEFTVRSINASYGPNTPLTMDAGSYSQLEKNFNIDVTYPIPVDAFASDLNFAAGFEWREEKFEAKIGDPESYNSGPLLSQGFSSGSQGYVGLSEDSAGEADRSNIAFYVDLEAEVTDDILIGLATRLEDFDDFGSTSNSKLSARWDISENLSLRSTIATGFRAPTPGQANVTNVSSVFDNGVLVNSGIIPPTTPLAMEFGGKALDPEESESFSFGVVFNIGALDVTIDYFDIDVEDRITLSSFNSISPSEAALLESQGIAGASEFANFRYYTNDFDTNSKGVDVVATYPINLFDGDTDLSLAMNWTETEVTGYTEGLLNATRIRTLEEGLPEIRGNLSLSHVQGPWRGLVRVNYYGDYYIAHASAGSLSFEPGAETTVDLELAYSFSDQLTVVAGANNAFDQYPDENPYGGILGSKYPEFSPMGINGGMYYLRLRYEL